jgi:hypothetical protein
MKSVRLLCRIRYEKSAFIVQTSSSPMSSFRILRHSDWEPRQPMTFMHETEAPSTKKYLWRNFRKGIFHIVQKFSRKSMEIFWDTDTYIQLIQKACPPKPWKENLFESAVFTIENQNMAILQIIFYWRSPSESMLDGIVSSIEDFRAFFAVFRIAIIVVSSFRHLERFLTVSVMQIKPHSKMNNQKKVTKTLCESVYLIFILFVPLNLNNKRFLYNHVYINIYIFCILSLYYWSDDVAM